MDGFEYSWDDVNMTLAYIAASKSKDKSTHHGCVITTKDNVVVTTGVNGFPRGINDFNVERQERPEKYFWMEHSERNAIYNAAREGKATKGCKMYITGMPCMDCARAIVQAGLEEIIIDSDWEKIDDEKWAESNKRTIQLFKEAGIPVKKYEGNFITPVKYFKGKTIPLIKIKE